MPTFSRTRTAALLVSAVVHVAAASLFVWPAGRLLEVGPADVAPSTVASDPAPAPFPIAARVAAEPHVEAVKLPARAASAISGLATHVWQSMLFALAVGATTLAFRREHASIRHWIWFSASLKFFVPFFLLTAAGRAL